MGRMKFSLEVRVLGGNRGKPAANLCAFVILVTPSASEKARFATGFAPEGRKRTVAEAVAANSKTQKS